MKKPPTQKPVHKDVKFAAFRLPSELHEELKLAAERNGRSLNAEVIARLQVNPIEALEAKVDRLETMVRQIFEKM